MATQSRGGAPFLGFFSGSLAIVSLFSLVSDLFHFTLLSFLYTSIPTATSTQLYRPLGPKANKVKLMLFLFPYPLSQVFSFVLYLQPRA